MAKESEKQELGADHGWQRCIATMIGFGPLVIFSYALQVYAEKPWPTSGRLLLFTCTILVSSFAYDAIKKFLTLPPDQFIKTWVHVRNLALFLGAYVLAIVVLALLPSSKLDWFDSIVGVVFFMGGLASSVAAMNSFVKAVKSSAE